MTIRFRFRPGLIFRGPVSRGVVQAFSFTGPTTPSGFTFTRAGTNATYRDSAGKLQIAAANAARYDYTIAGLANGLRIEGAVTNKNTNTNNTPAATTNVTKSGDAASTLTLVSDTTAIAASTCKLDAVVTGNVFELNNSAGVAPAVATFGGVTGNTNPHSISVWARMVSGTGAIALGGVGSTNFSGAAYQRVVSANITPSTSADQFTITVPAGATCRFILNQLEELQFASSEIIISGAAGTRALDNMSRADLITQAWFNKDQGYIAVRWKPEGHIGTLVTNLQHLVTVSDAGTNNSYALRMVDDDKDTSLRWVAGGVAGSPTSTNYPHYVNQQSATAFSWTSTLRTLTDGDTTTTSTTTVTPPVSITTLNIGARNAGNEPLFGWVQSVEIGTWPISATSLIARSYTSSDIMVAGSGQSLMVGHWQSQDSGSAGGRNKMIETISQSINDKAIMMLNGATGGTYATSLSGSPYWYDVAGAARGVPFNTFYSVTGSYPYAPKYILWDQGQADSGPIGQGTVTKAQYKAALRAIFADMNATYPSAKILIQRIFTRTGVFNNSNNVGCQAVREVQQELIDELSYVYRMSSTYDLAQSADDLHMTDAAYVTAGQRNGRFIANLEGATNTGVNGPYVSAVSRSGTTVTITIVHDGGTDISPASAIAGFHFYDGAVGVGEITINTAVRTNATTITLTLASAPVSGTETLVYIYGAEYSLVKANVVKDNATVSMPLAEAKFTGAAGVFTNDYLAGFN